MEAGRHQRLGETGALPFSLRGLLWTSLCPSRSSAACSAPSWVHSVMTREPGLLRSAGYLTGEAGPTETA